MKRIIVKAWEFGTAHPLETATAGYTLMGVAMLVWLTWAVPVREFLLTGGMCLAFLMSGRAMGIRAQVRYQNAVDRSVEDIVRQMDH